MTCPRAPLPVAQEFGGNLDEWASDGTCSYCGSLSGSEALMLIEAGIAVRRWENGERLYLGADRRLVYWAHFNAQQRDKLAGLVRVGKVQIG